ncbi:MAG TPA: carboxypeptidase-like regulatory domain-containing protein [Blastocatellia bacterium]|nr:carboxypeptidase-like regulatory domain-containing protein [Blastocatellia bacterium]
MPLVFVNALALLLAVSAFLTWSVQPPATGTGGAGGTVSGKVIGPYELGLGGVTVRFRSMGENWTTVTDASGSYALALPEGIYTVSAQTGDSFRFRRSPFKMINGAHISINLRLVYKVIDMSTGQLKNQRSYEEISRAPGLLVAFAQRTVTRDMLVYDSAALSFDTTSVEADRIELNRNDLSIRATGNVMVENELPRRRVKEARLQFADGKMVIDVVTGAIRAISGSGSIENDAVEFTFNVEQNKRGHFTYSDKDKGVRFESTDVLSFEVVNDSSEEVTFAGSAFLEPGGVASATFTVRVTAQAPGGRSIFAIELLGPLFSRSGTINRGRILISRDF